LIWYDEPLPALAQCVVGLKNAGVDHLVAVDGRYHLYPGDEFLSPLDQQGGLIQVCRSLGLGVTVHVPPHEWLGNEVEKRTHLFTLGAAEAEVGDWFFVIDADVVVSKTPPDLKERLAATEHEAAFVMVHDMNAAAAQRDDWPEYFMIRALFKAQPIVVKVNHYTYVSADGQRLLWNAGDEDHPHGDIVPALDLRREVEIQHRPGVRQGERQMAKAQWYATREEMGVERDLCEKCRKQGVQKRAARRVPVKWHRSPIGITSPIAELCEQHARIAERQNERRMRTWGILCGCKVPSRVAHMPGQCASCGKPIKASDGFRVIERNGRPILDAKDLLSDRRREKAAEEAS